MCRKFFFPGNGRSPKNGTRPVQGNRDSTFDLILEDTAQFLYRKYDRTIAHWEGTRLRPSTSYICSVIHLPRSEE